LPSVTTATVPDLDDLAQLALLEGLTTEQLESVRSHLHCRTFPTGTNVVYAEQPGEVIFLILSGTVKVQVDQADGTEVILAVLGARQSIGEMSATDTLGRSASVITLDDTTLAWIDVRTFSNYLQSIPRLSQNLARVLSGRLRVANAQIQALATQDVYGRVARQLVSLAEQYGVDDPDGGRVIPMRLKQADLASLVGASRVRVNQVLAFYKESGYISFDNSYRITVKNHAALAARCL
jgi:CRP/FNR family cyclic AMP-dependent transcriptional regulator